MQAKSRKSALESRKLNRSISKGQSKSVKSWKVWKRISVTLSQAMKVSTKLINSTRSMLTLKKWTLFRTKKASTLSMRKYSKDFSPCTADKYFGVWFKMMTSKQSLNRYWLGSLWTLNQKMSHLKLTPLPKAHPMTSKSQTAWGLSATLLK